MKNIYKIRFSEEYKTPPNEICENDNPDNILIPTPKEGGCEEN